MRAVVCGLGLFLSIFGLVKTAQAFSDADLDALRKVSSNSSVPTVVYSWSPHMALSVKGLSELELFLRTDHPGFKLVVLLDPDADQIEAEKVAQTQKWDSAYLERNKSTTLLKSGSKIHFPNYVFFSAGKTESHLIAGYKSQPAFERLLRKYK